MSSLALRISRKRALMEISDDIRPVHSAEELFEADIERVFHETLGLVHIALVSHYQLGEQEATELEKDLFVWFRRFCYRPGATPRENRPFLLVACCQFAREYQKYLVGSGVRASDTNLTQILDREPSDVAHDFSRSLMLYDFRRSDA
jgi:hypothetical protein